MLYGSVIYIFAEQLSSGLIVQQDVELPDRFQTHIGSTTFLIFDYKLYDPSVQLKGVHGLFRQMTHLHLRKISLPRVHSNYNTNFNKTAISQYLNVLQKTTTT